MESFSQMLSDEKSVNRTKMDVFVVHVPLNLNSVYVGSRLSYLHLILTCVIPDIITGEARLTLSSWLVISPRLLNSVENRH